MNAILPIFSALGVFLALLIESFFPYPHIVEEVIKFALIFILLKSKDHNILIACLIGLFFGITETVLFSYTSLLNGGIELFVNRAIITIPLHTLTTLIIYYFGNINKKLMFIGLLAAIFVHYVYNLFAVM